MKVSVVIENVSRSVEEQKRHYKDGAKSLCRKCTNYNKDCFDAFKSCGKDDKSGYSTVEKCSSFNKPLESDK